MFLSFHGKLNLMKYIFCLCYHPQFTTLFVKYGLLFQVLLLMESEFLRRLSLCFCLELRSNIHNTDWMKTVKNICDNIIEKAESSLEQLVIALKYSKAMGFSERRSRSRF